MDSVIDGILDDTDKYWDDAKPLIETIFTSRDNYTDYFVSHPLPGSIVEEIAETDAAIVALEKQLKDRLIGAKKSIIAELAEGDVESYLSSISEEIGELWELDNSRSQVDLSSATDEEDVEAVIGEIEASGSDEHGAAREDAFHEALSRLRKHEEENSDANLMYVLQNIDKISELLEIPALASTCIKTGHYQEALLCHSHALSLQHKFPNIDLIASIASAVHNNISKTMLQGLVKLLGTNLTINAMKKVIQYLSSIEPLQGNPPALQQLFISMRYRFLASEINSYVVPEDASDAVNELLAKRKIECVREHFYSIIAVFNSMFTPETIPLQIPLFNETKSQNSKEIPTSLHLLQFVENATEYLLKQLAKHKSSAFTESVCLQLVYCSFRLGDINYNFHHLFMNKLLESKLFTQQTLEAAMAKRLDLAANY
ncbi:HGL253Wp [Eremothecium sinecaudum]|uniref:Conserved oligomeric Golgi complex subunit 8 n=1 Tax=Eremothecium sinecaudum TaxID=45286 RepID=A0A0X8HV43_9SACH|nr:HGL253Wp [Eremothecium sinecaudum]AMD22087.1 HGL253Wp [Eremothecium sinecaudum]